MPGVAYWLIAAIVVTASSALWVQLSPLDLSSLPEKTGDTAAQTQGQTREVADPARVRQWYGELEKLKLWAFSSQNTAPQPTTQGKPGKGKKDKAIANNNTPRLVGIVQTGGKRTALFLTGDKLERINAGQSLASGWKAESIKSGQVVLQHSQNGRKEFRLYKGE